MQRYRHAPLLPLGVGLLVFGGCSTPSQRENVDAAAQLVVGQVSAPLVWRLDPKADAEARERVDALLTDGVTLEEAIKVAFLAGPELQLALERLEISRADLVAATTISNPVLVGGTRQPQGDLAAFYPDRTISFGVVQSLIGLLTIPGRRGVAKHDLERARYEAARSAVRLAAEVAQAWIDYSGELQKQVLCERAVAVARKAYDNQLAAQATGATTPPSRGDLLARQRDAIRAQLRVTKARAELEEQMGIAGWRDDWTVLQTLPSLPASDPDPVAEEQAAMERRLDLRAANEAIEARLRLLAHKRRFRWLSQLDIGIFREQVVGGTSFTGPNAAIELPLFDQRQSQLLNADSELRSELRRRELTRLGARKEIRNAAAEMAATRRLLEQVEGEILPTLRQQQADPAGGDPDDVQTQTRRLANMDTEVEHIELLRNYWRARSALALAVGDWTALSGLP
jgi:cobalt-zinc-cadmium efflux system outer membrane protein